LETILEISAGSIALNISVINKLIIAGSPWEVLRLSSPRKALHSIIGSILEAVTLVVSFCANIFVIHFLKI
jgi:hypothetical protein